MTIWVDAKNPAIYGSGISHWLHDLLADIAPSLRSQMVLAVPDSSNEQVYPDLAIPRVDTPWIKSLPRRFSQLLYDNYSFQRTAKRAKPALIFSPYYDVLVPKGIPAVITIHDLCYVEAAKQYPFLQRTYFIAQMKRNLKRAGLVVTVSETSKSALVDIIKIPASKIQVIENTLGSDFNAYTPAQVEIDSFRDRTQSPNPIVLYTGGFENRKNIPNLVAACKILNTQESPIQLMVTGNQKQQWLELLGSDTVTAASITFTGYLNDKDLKAAYLAANAVVAPSLSEGYGRSCLEAIATGTPLACSDIKVFHEVSGEDAIYFDPHSPLAIADGIRKAINRNRGSSQTIDTARRLTQIREFEDKIVKLARL